MRDALDGSNNQIFLDYLLHNETEHWNFAANQMNGISFARLVNPNTISVVIPVYKDISGLTDTIASIFECDRIGGTELEIIIVNDGADSSISAFCREQRLLEVTVSPNRGSYYARNRGIEQSCGQYIGFVDADIFVDKQWIVSAIDHLNIYDYVAGNILVIRDGVSKTVADYQQFVDFNTKWHMESIHYGPTANIWVRRTLLERIGGFNESFYSGGDMEFGKRVYNHVDLKMHYAETLIVEHPPRSLWALLSKSKRLAHGHNVIGAAYNLQSEFTIIQSIKRNFAKNSPTRQLPTLVYLLKVLLYAHRAFYKVFYKCTGNSFEYQTISAPQSGPTKVQLHDHR